MSQVALVVHDPEDAMRRYRRIPGIESVGGVLRRPPDQRQARYRGQPTDAALRIGYAGSQEVEIIEPLGGRSVYAGFPADRGEEIITSPVPGSGTRARSPTRSRRLASGR